MKKIALAIFLVMLAGCGDAGKAMSRAAWNDSGLSAICFQGVTYLVTQKGGITAQFTQDGHVVPCTR